MAYYKSNTRWQKKNTTLQTIRLNNYSDLDILKFLETKSNKQGYIKDLIRKDMEKENFICPHPSKQEIADYEEYLGKLENGGIDKKEDYRK